MGRIVNKLFIFGVLVVLGSAGIPACQPSQASYSRSAGMIDAAKSHRFKIRTITAGVNLKSTADVVTIESAIKFLQRAKKKFTEAGYEIQTLRIATQPLPEYLNGKSR